MRLALFVMTSLLWALPAAALVLPQDSVWRGELRFAEEVRVPQGVTLRVAPGAVVRFTGGGLTVAGTLLAEQAEFSGEGWDGLTLKGVDAATLLKDCTVRGAKVGIQLQGGAPRLEGLTVTGNRTGIEVRGRGAGRISGCLFADNEKVGLFLKDDSSTAVVDCRFEGNGRFGAYLYRARPTEFAGNRFSGNDTGLMVAYHGSDPELAGNRFEKNRVGVLIDRAARPLLRGNLILDNGIGIHCYRRSDPRISGNLISGNATGVLVSYSSYPRIAGNDLPDNGVALKLEFQSSTWEKERGASARAEESAARSAFSGQGAKSVGEAERRATRLDGTLDAAGNWWGARGTAELTALGAAGNPAFIHDGRDQELFEDGGRNYPLDRALFAPWSERALTELKP